ncbi:MAG: hypothetical protein H7A36_00745 [Chlamydiales bacterium]|nr:hypothetical protein [Chlamydiales bacterium]
MVCCGDVQRNRDIDHEAQCCCCSSKTAWLVTAVAGLAIAVFGALLIASITTGSMTPIRQLAEKISQGTGAALLTMPIVITAIGGAMIIGSALGYCHRNREQAELV